MSLVPIIGIDWGTTTSCLSYYNVDKKQVDIIPNEQGSFTSPSLLYLDPDSYEMLFGEAVLNLNESKSSNIFSNIKRLIGSNIDKSTMEFFKNNTLNDSNSECIFKVLFDKKEQNISLKMMISFYLNYLKSIIKNNIGIYDTYNVVITVPVYFNDTQRTILKQCCEYCSLNVLRIINEPTAASLAYAFDKNKLEKNKPEYILTFDSGGGTTDISLLYLDYVEDLYEVKNTIGDNLLGGEDITYNLINFIIQKLRIDVNGLSKRNYNKIKNEAENAKKNLSFNFSHTIYLEFGDIDYHLVISQTQFIDINKEFFAKIKNLIYYVLDDYISKNPAFEYNQIESVVFVGATTKIPYFKTIFNDILPNIYINNTIDPDKTVSIGAAIQGALISNLIDSDQGGDILLLDVIPLSIGIETVGGIMTPIISRNNLIPISRTKQFTNSDCFDDTIVINIYQGERKFVKDNIHLGSFELKSDLFKQYNKGEITISIEFDIDSNSIINALAYANIGNNSSVKSSIQVTKEQSNYKSKETLQQLLYYSEITKLVDSERSGKVLAKIELYDSFKYLLSVFHEKYSSDSSDSSDGSDDKSIIFTLNNLFNHTFNVIEDFENYTTIELNSIKETFEKKWHLLLFGGSVILKDSDGLIVEFGGTTIQ